MHGLKLLELAPDSNGVLEVRVPRPTASVGLANTTALMLPLRMIGLNRRWSVGVLQLRGYCVGHYGSCENRYRSLGVDDANHSHVPLYPGRAAITHLQLGHPVIALGARAHLLSIQVTAVGSAAAGPDGRLNVSTSSGSMRWHASVHNAEATPITARVVAGFGPPQSWGAATAVTVPAGGTVVLS